MIVDDFGLTWGVASVIVAALIALIVVGGGLVWAILKVRQEPAPAMLTVTLGLLTLVAVLTFALTRQNVLATIAATGVGALAASLTNVLQHNKQDKDDPDDRKEE